MYSSGDEVVVGDSSNSEYFDSAILFVLLVGIVSNGYSHHAQP